MTDFQRNVFCVMGLPIDAVSMDQAVASLERAKLTREKCFFSTPNLNFSMASLHNVPFRESVCKSHLSLADGMPLVWVSRLLNIPIHERVSGSDLFDRLRQQTRSLWRVFFFGGPEGAGQSACLAIGNNKSGVLPSGYIYPGFVNTEEMSRDDLMACINQSNSDMVLVALGAAKGQDWICRNLDRIHAPVVGHLGAVINFAAGHVQRAPVWMQRSGLEWLWRIKEESSLWRRYWQDGSAFLKVLATRVIPLALHQKLNRPSAQALDQAEVQAATDDNVTHIRLRGAWQARNSAALRISLAQALKAGQRVEIDMAQLHSLDSACLALLLLLDQALRDAGLSLRLRQVPARVQRYLVLSCVHHLELD
jgi:N-acetylglucosaminyldiphosphoundecaprenol N-acetyl-beta-D-mannosaminyltransferase